jgi:hypothetical protein
LASHFLAPCANASHHHHHLYSHPVGYILHVDGVSILGLRWALEACWWRSWRSLALDANRSCRGMVINAVAALFQPPSCCRCGRFPSKPRTLHWRVLAVLRQSISPTPLWTLFIMIVMISSKTGDLVHDGQSTSGKSTVRRLVTVTFDQQVRLDMLSPPDQNYFNWYLLRAWVSRCRTKRIGV